MFSLRRSLLRRMLRSREPARSTTMKESPIDIHTRVGNDYRNWKYIAQTLFASSEILRREHDKVRPTLKPGPAPKETLTTWSELMLTAFGIECLIKAIWLTQGHQLARNGKYVPMLEKDGHRLEKLCRKAGIVLNQREEQALVELSDIAGSIGRYPIPSRARQTTDALGWSSGDDDVIANLIVRLKIELRNYESAKARKKTCIDKLERSAPRSQTTREPA